MDEFLHSGMHWQFVNFFIFAGGLFYFLKNPVIGLIRKRHELIREEVDLAKKENDEARLAYTHLTRRKTGLKKELSDLSHLMESEMGKEEKRILEEGERLVASLKKEGTRIAEQEIRSLKKELQKEMVQWTKELTIKIIREQYSSADQKKIETDFVQKVEGMERRLLQ